jgi:hypothetical protein
VAPERLKRRWRWCSYVLVITREESQREMKVEEQSGGSSGRARAKELD